MKRIVLVLTICMLIVANAMGRDQKPSWVGGYHRDLTNSYIDVFSATGNTDEEARKKAVLCIVDERSRATGRRYSIQESNGDITITNSEDELTVKCRIVDEYHTYQKDGRCTVSLLVQTAKHPEYSFENITVTDNYGVSPVVMSIVPGLGQWYKGSKVKGICLFTAETASVVGMLLCENQANSYEKKIKQTPKFAKEYDNKKTNWETGRNICIGAGVAIWIYNIVDAAVAKGSRRVKVQPYGEQRFGMTPVVTTEYTGLSLSYSF